MDQNLIAKIVDNMTTTNSPDSPRDSGFGFGFGSVAKNATTILLQSMSSNASKPLTTLSTDSSPGADPAKAGLSTPSSEEDSGISTELAIILGLGLSLVFVLIVSLIIFGVSRSGSKTKKPASKQTTSTDSEGDDMRKAHSLLSDLPSTDVQSIVIDSTELKPVKSDVFRWKEKGKHNPNPDKKKKAKLKEKLDIKPKDKPKDKKKDKKPKKDPKEKDRKEKGRRKKKKAVKIDKK